MPVVSVSMPADLIERLDEFADEHGYTGRSEVVREGVRILLEEFEDERLEDRPLAGVVSVRYSYGTNGVERRVTRLRHEHEAQLTSNVHSHVGDSCLELFVLEGSLEDVSAFVGRARSIEDVASVEYTVIPLDTVEGDVDG